jgi:hypothetical protein
MTKEMSLNDFEIRKVDLETYRFSPPGSMGWSAAEYEHILNHPEAASSSESFSPPGVPSTALQELSSSLEHQVELQSLDVQSSEDSTARIPKKEDEKKPNIIEIKNKSIISNEKETNKANQLESEAENQEDPDKEEDSGYIIDPNPPAKPWLANHLISFYK